MPDTLGADGQIDTHGLQITLSVEQTQFHAISMERVDGKIHPAAATMNQVTSPQRPGLTGVA
jgi:hypothetical protein